jgi:hypothetical protein
MRSGDYRVKSNKVTTLALCKRVGVIIAFQSITDIHVLNKTILLTPSAIIGSIMESEKLSNWSFYHMC